jgi:hypothetical protein
MKTGSPFFVAFVPGSIKDGFNLRVGDSEKRFKAVLPAENLKILPQDYQVLISDKGITYLKSIDGSMEYWISCSAQDSEFGSN